MKKIIIILLFFPVISYSQFKFGGHIGLNSSSFTNKLDRINTNLIYTESNGINIGITAEYSLSDKVSVYTKLGEEREY